MSIPVAGNAHSIQRRELQRRTERAERVATPVVQLTALYQFSCGVNRQENRISIFCPFLVLPENWFDAKLALLLNQAADVVTQEFAENFVDHREITF